MPKSTKKRPPASTKAGEAAKPPSKSVKKQAASKTVPPSKQSRVVMMLQSPQGATIDAMMKATGWQQHSVRGFLAGIIRKRMKLTLKSEKTDGKRIYRVTGGSKTASRSQGA